MITANNLPSDILRLIFECDSTPAHLETEHFGSWRDRLAVLAVCRHWRSAAKGVVYARAIVEFGRNNRHVLDYTDADDDDDDDDDGGVHTNIDLIIQNGAQHMASQLTIAIHRDDSPDITLAYLADDLSIGEAECPRRSVVEDYDTDEWPRPAANVDLNKSRMCIIARDLSVAVSTRLPHICKISFELYDISAAHRRFVDGLFDAYIDQLTCAYCESDKYFPNLQPATRLQSVSLSVSYPYGGGINPFLPGVLRNLHLKSDEFYYTWDDLRADKESCVVQFSGLRALHIENNGPHYYTAGDTFAFGFEFPQLVKLLLRCVRITPNIVECLKKAPLKQVHFEGTPADALLLCPQLPKGLEELNVHLDRDFHEVPIDEFVHDVKALLPRLRAKRLVCAICSRNQFLDISSFDLSHISKFILHADFDPDVLVSKIPSMMSMVDLSIGLEAFDEEKTNSLISTLMSMRQHYNVLHYSNIEVVSFEHEVYPNINDAFLMATNEFYYLLPRLKSLVYTLCENFFL